jgi:hypothetical protein
MTLRRHSRHMPFAALLAGKRADGSVGTGASLGRLVNANPRLGQTTPSILDPNREEGQAIIEVLFSVHAERFVAGLPVMQRKQQFAWLAHTVLTRELPKGAEVRHQYARAYQGSRFGKDQ